MAYRTKRKPKRRATRRRKTTRGTKRPKGWKTLKTLGKLAGYTRTKGKYALVFSKGGKKSLGKGRFKNMKTLRTKAKRYLQRQRNLK